MFDSIIDVVPWWVFALLGVALLGVMAYVTFIIAWVPTWIFWAMLGTIGAGGVVGLLQALSGGGV